MVCGTDFTFFLHYFITILHYYIVNTLLNSFYSRRRIIPSFFGAAAIYKCSAATECSHRVFAMGKSAWH